MTLEAFCQSPGLAEVVVFTAVATEGRRVWRGRCRWRFSDIEIGPKDACHGLHLHGADPLFPLGHRVFGAVRQAACSWVCAMDSRSLGLAAELATTCFTGIAGCSVAAGKPCTKGIRQASFFVVRRLHFRRLGRCNNVWQSSSRHLFR